MEDSFGEEGSSRALLFFFLKAKVSRQPFYYPRP